MKYGQGLYGQGLYGKNTPPVRKYLKIFDRNHAILAEIDRFSSLKYSWTLNGFGKANFSLGLESAKNTPTNLEFMNHVEIWDNTGLIWGGKIVDRAFNDGKTDVFMYGYLSMLDKRRFIAHSYTERTYGALFTTMLADINAIEQTGITLGTIQTGSLNTQRLVNSTDFLLKKLQDYCVDGNYDMDVDKNRKLNFYLRKGSIKNQYILEYGGQADNILVAPSLAQSSLNLANSIYSETSTLTSTATDTLSRALYGLQESVLSGNDSVILQDTLNNNTSSELQRSAYPANSLSLRIKDSTLCPYNDIEVGDSIPVHLILSKFWDFMDTLRILEMTHNEDDGTRDLVVGQTLYRPAPAITKTYRK